MPICVCEFCGKPFNNIAVKLCAPCSKIIEETYTKTRRFMYQNPTKCNFINIIEEIEVPEKALSYLINKGRIEIANRAGSGAKCRACGKEMNSGSICESCMSKLISEKLRSSEAKTNDAKKANEVSDKKRIVPISYGER